jgi:chromosome segregation ATPase
MAEFLQTESSKALLDKLFQSGKVNPDLLVSNDQLLDQLHGLQDDIRAVKSELSSKLTQETSLKGKIDSLTTKMNSQKVELDNLRGQNHQLRLDTSRLADTTKLAKEYKAKADELETLLSNAKASQVVSLEGLYQYLKVMLDGRTNMFSSTSSKLITVNINTVDKSGNLTSGIAFQFRRDNKDSCVITQRSF